MAQAGQVIDPRVGGRPPCVSESGHCAAQVSWSTVSSSPVITVAELDVIGAARLEDAKALLTAGRFDGAAYLCGYAVEVSLKARICRVLNWPEFPGTGSEFQAYRSFQTHELDVLLRLSGQEARIRQHYFTPWSAVAVWKVETRYNVIGTARQSDAAAMIQAAEDLRAVL